MQSLKRLIQKIDPYPFLLVAASVVGMAALFQPGFIETHDGLFHLHRMVAFDEALRAGDLYPRWFPDFALGYGYPVINFYAPLSYYVAELFHLVGFGLSEAEKMTFAASLVLSGLTMYLWLSETFQSRRAGFIAAFAYMYFPYRMVDIYVRGALAENVAFIFMPLLLWSTYKIVVKWEKAHIAGASVILALLVLTHNITALFFVPVWGGYTLLLLLFGPGVLSTGLKGIVQRGLAVTAALMIGLALSSFYWLPALQEQIYVSTDNFIIAGSDPVTQISAFDSLIQTSWLFDYVKRPIMAGFIQLLAFVIGASGVLYLVAMGKHLTFSAKPYITHGLFFVLLSIAGLLMMSPLAIPIWESVPLIGFIQFPWRLLGFFGFGTSVLMGLLALTRKSFWLLALPTVAIMAFTTMNGMPLLHTYLADSDLTIAEAVRYEFDSSVFGGTASAEYMPVWAKSSFSIPRDDPGIRASARPREASRLAMTLREVGPGFYRLAVTSPEGGPLRLHQFFFPGWQAKVDGQYVNCYASSLLGLVTVNVPPGDHDVELLLGDSPVRYLAGVVSLLALFVVIAAYYGAVRARRRVSSYSVPAFSLIFVAAYFLGVGPADSPKNVGGSELAAHSFRSEAFNLGSLRLAAFEIDSRDFAKEGKLKTALYWQSLGTAVDSTVRLRLLDASGNVVGTRMTRPVFGTGRTYLWSTDELVKDEVSVSPERSLPAGLYTVEVSNMAGGEALGTAVLGTVTLPAVRMEKALPAMTPADKIFGDKIKLLGYKIGLPGGRTAGKGRPSIAPNETIDITLYWQALEDMDTDYTVFIHFVDLDGKLWTQEDHRPRAGYSYTAQWHKGEIIEDRYPMLLPTLLPEGGFRLEMGLYYQRTMKRLPIVGQSGNVLMLGMFKMPAKTVSLVRPINELNTVLGDSMKIVGACIGDKDARREGATLLVASAPELPLPVRLFWRAEKEMDKDYTVFLHVLDGSGKVVAQIDRQPRSGQYPTTFWAPGEEITDDYDIILRGLPPGEYQLRAGAYLLENLTRLKTATGEDNVIVGTVRIVDQGN